ncbi:hypothetical protein M408DRAFT_331483 [Serendipita vermifera MAFF 305830]|uniref:F-box domain-containing protein n=1 Tax=Serendipita vermifera MAFF 305830 TaxID=933852 RepID=A0A0C2WEZ9_SERVB|nr:hypothetical protein M408DRAFT_331483 [Serendipita vermifera MAFF 305830]
MESASKILDDKMEANREVTSGVQKTLCNDDATNGSDLLPSIPSQPQLPQTHGWIAEEANESSQPQSPHEENEKSSKDLEETTTRVTITPINRLPFEILGLIFMIHVWGHDRTPWILAHVSRTWRAAAFMTKTLWTCILVAPPNWKLLASSRRDLSRQEVCYKTGQFNRALSRADGAPLDLKVIDFLQTLGNRRSSAETRTRKDFPSINDMSPGKNSVKVPVRALNVDTSVCKTKLDVERFTFYTLDSLMLRGEQPKLIDKVVAETRGMRTLNVPSTTMQKLSKCTWWETLEEFSIIGPFPFDELKALKSALSNCKTLKTLEFVDGASAWHQLEAESGKVPLPSLKRLKLHSLSVFWPVECPDITHLALIMPCNSGTLARRSIRLPHLVELRVVTSPSGDNIWVFDAPSLYRLVLQSGWGKTSNAHLLQNMWPSSTSTTSSPSTVEPVASGIEPRVFELQHTEINEELLANALKERPLLEEFSAVGLPISQVFFDALNVDATVPVEQHIDAEETTSWTPLSMLKRLVIDNNHHPNQQSRREELEGSITTWLKARVNAQLPLERMAIRYPNEEHWTEF